MRDERGLVDEMKPGDFKLVSHKIPWSHIHDKPPVSKGGVLMRMPANSRVSRVLLFSVLLLFVVVALLQARLASRLPIRALNPPPTRGQCAFIRCLQVRGSGDLQDLSRGNLQRLGENAALEDHTK